MIFFIFLLNKYICKSTQKADTTADAEKIPKNIIYVRFFSTFARKKPGLRHLHRQQNVGFHAVRTMEGLNAVSDLFVGLVRLFD